VLGLKSLGINDPIHFDFLEPPSQPALLRALTELFVLGALSSSSAELTTLGRQMAELPLEPPMSKMLIVSHVEHKCAVQAAAAVAILSLQNSAFTIPRGKRDDAEATTQRFFLGSYGDACGYARIFADWEAQGRGTHWTRAHFLNPTAMQRAFDVRNQIVGALSRLFAEPLTSDTNIATAEVGVARSFVAGFFQNAARLAIDTVSYNVIKSRAQGVFVHPSSCFASYVAPTPAQRQRRAEERAKRGVGLDESHAAFQNCNHVTGKPELVVFSELRQTSRAFMSHVIAVTPDWLIAAAPLHYFRSDDLGSAPTAPAASAPLRRLREPETAAGRAGAQLIDEMNF
jgi:pre-mRNA-splicing factor ATP-dependent RNA helicase DHX16